MTGFDARNLLTLQRAAFRSQGAPDARTRKDALSRLEHMLLANTDRIVAAIDADFGGRARAETELLECVPALRAIRHARRHVARWMRPQRRSIDLVFQPSKAWVRFEPLGVVGIVAPWNYPLLLSVGPLCDALAAGNRALIKPSELTPAFSALLHELIADAFDPSEISVIVGDVTVAEAFTALPFDHLVFTGSTAVGRKVMRAAAENLTPVTLELGGKSPAIVAPDYPLEKAARSVAFGKFLNAGQTCIAPDYALVPNGQVQVFARLVLEAAKRGYPTVSDNEQYSAVITARHRDRLNAAIAEVRDAGIEVLTFDEQPATSAKIAPTVVIDPPSECMLMREEIFGPVLPIISYHTIDQASGFVADRDKPLALYLFTNDARTRDRVLDTATSGGVTLNGTLLHIAQENLPFGGVGPSGMGAYHGYEGFRRLSHARSVHAIGFVNVFEKLGPPWGRVSAALSRFLARH